MTELNTSIAAASLSVMLWAALSIELSSVRNFVDE